MKDLRSYDEKVVSEFKLNSSGKDAEMKKTKRGQVNEQNILIPSVILQLPASFPIPVSNPGTEHSVGEHK